MQQNNCTVLEMNGHSEPRVEVNSKVPDCRGGYNNVTPYTKRDLGNYKMPTTVTFMAGYDVFLVQRAVFS